MVLKLHFTLHNGLVLDLIIGWHCLKARAIENDMYVAANGCGNDGNTEYAGYSTVINPNGEIVQELGSDEGVLTTNVDLELVDQQKSLYCT